MVRGMPNCIGSQPGRFQYEKRNMDEEGKEKRGKEQEEREGEEKTGEATRD